MTKLIVILCVLAVLAGLYWTLRVGGGDGSWLAIVVPAVIAVIVLLLTKRNTGKWLSDSSGGH